MANSAKCCKTFELRLQARTKSPTIALQSKAMMQTLFRAWWWLLGSLVFFSVFAFALNNREVVTVHWFFGYQSQIQLVLLVLLTLMAGVFLGALAVLPLWWRQYRLSRAETAANSGGGEVPHEQPNPSTRLSGGQLLQGQGLHAAEAGVVDAV